MVKIISRQREARNEQHFVADPALPVCENCAHYRSVFVENQWGGLDEKKRRCALGHFAVKRKSTCAVHKFKTGDAVETAERVNASKDAHRGDYVEYG